MCVCGAHTPAAAHRAVCPGRARRVAHRAVCPGRARRVAHRAVCPGRAPRRTPRRLSGSRTAPHTAPFVRVAHVVPHVAPTVRAAHRVVCPGRTSRRPPTTPGGSCPPRLLKAHNLVRTGFCSVVPPRPIRFIPCECFLRKRCNLRNYRDTVFALEKTAATNRAGTGLCTTSCTGAHTLRGSFWDPSRGVLLRYFFARKCITRHRFARLRRAH
jgi:hypothetical protein